METIRLLKDQHPSALIVVTGHSLGAALATFAAVDLITLFELPAEKFVFYNFGSPRTGNQAWTDLIFSLFPTGSYRITHSNDPVPQQPAMILGFSHFANEIWYNVDSNTDKSFKECEN